MGCNSHLVVRVGLTEKLATKQRLAGGGGVQGTHCRVGNEFRKEQRDNGHAEPLGPL